jgi:LytS/YehU family sensor histidine kinase
MNPHFLFNCLNSINSFIIKNEQEKASEYLSKFSKLIRRVLNNSKSSKVTLANELEALELYIELEALRFNEKFNYKITVDSDIETDYIEIPPLIIQPYVENSIWHGLMHKTNGTGTLRINIRKEDEVLVCIIEDNGIGREAAKQLKSKTAVKRKSYGMNITKERLQYINHSNNHNGKRETTNIDVIDLKDEVGNPTGTRVIIKIKAEK